MSFFAWPRAGFQQPPRQHLSTTPLGPSTSGLEMRSSCLAMEPSAIADEVIKLSTEIHRARELCEQADLVIKKQEAEIKRLRDTVNNLTTSNKGLRDSCKSLQAAVVEKNTIINQQSAQLEIVQAERDALRDSVIHLRLKLRAEDFGDVYSHGQATEDTNSLLTLHAHLRPVPFVVVLVDGDSYRFDLKSKTSNNAGPEKAHDLHREISKYILSHPRIPPDARIVVRIFCNRSSMLGKIATPRKARNSGSGPLPITNHSEERLPVPTVETMAQFAETYPLFDYLDCGGGKERVDDRIRENTHLYVADNNCHAIFLAICNDNGYARMLERYDNNPIPAAKIVLLTNGHVTTEMAKLSFPKVELNGIFHQDFKKKLKQGSSAKIGDVIEASHLQGFQTASDYDLDYTNPPVRERIDTLLSQMRQEKQKESISPEIFVRLPYESNESYEIRLRDLVSRSRSSVSGGERRRLVSYVGLRKARPAGLLPSAPILPFLLHSEGVHSTHVHNSGWTEGGRRVGSFCEEASLDLD